MKIKCSIFLISITLFLKTNGQTININSITSSRQPATGTNGYTLDGMWMSESRQKLLDASNFGSGGIYPKNISIFDSYGTTGSLTQVSSTPLGSIFFFGAFNIQDASTKQFSTAEIDTLYNWSKRGGKLIIASGGRTSSYESEILDSKWGYSYQSKFQSNFIPNLNGNNTLIFNGPFGNIISATQGGTGQGYFNSLTPNSIVFANDSSGNATLFMDCNTLDLIVADIDAYTTIGDISGGSAISNSQDKFWANTIVFMDKLQPPPLITNTSKILTLNSTYNNYQWYFNDTLISGADSASYPLNKYGNYYVQVTVNGGCNIKSNIFSNDTAAKPCNDIFLPTAFSPNTDGQNDIYYVRGSCINTMTFQIFNRWGEKVFETTNQSKGWDGTYKNQLCSSDVFTYYLNATLLDGTPVTKNGYVMLVR